MIADVVQHIAGDKARVITLIGEGVDPHLYSATRGDIVQLLGADIVFFNGLMLEGKMAGALDRISKKRPVHAVTESIDASRLLSHDAAAAHADPHAWMDVALWRNCAADITNRLAEFDPDNAGYYRDRFSAYAAELARLDEYGRRTIATIPRRSRVLVTAHDAFNYFARAYDIEVRGIQGISTESEAGIADINSLVHMLVERRVQAIFVESSVSQRNVKALCEGAAAQGQAIKVGGTLFSDAMGRPGTYEGTYVGMVDHNITMIVRGLGGEAPERGMQGKLSPIGSTTAENQPAQAGR